MRLAIIRHAQTEWNRTNRAQGHSDIPLDATGVVQVRLLGERFRGERVDKVLTSDLSRSRDTASAVADACSAPLETIIDLRERSFGDWEGLDFATIHKRLWATSHPDPFEQVPPSGESFRMVWERLDRVVARLNAESGRIVVVTHGGAAALLMAKLLRGTVETSRAFRFANTGVTELHRREDGLYRLERYNDTTHLEAGALAGDLDGTHR